MQHPNDKIENIVSHFIKTKAEDYQYSGCQGYVYCIPKKISSRFYHVGHHDCVVKTPKTNNQTADLHFKREISMLQQLKFKYHPNIIKTDFISEDYIIMERGGKTIIDLQDILSQDEEIDLYFKQSICCAFAADMIDVLLFLTEQNIRHNDMHRHNFILGNDGVLKLIDFGLAEKLEVSFFAIQNPITHIEEEKVSFKDFHPIDTIIRTLSCCGTNGLEEVISSLLEIGQDETTKQHPNETLEDIILSKEKNTEEKQQAFETIKIILENASDILRHRAAFPEEITHYFSTL